jgi:predicted enzyme related to lactoylglutathione lyase
MGRPVHFEIHAADPGRAERFYRTLFGWEIERFEGAPIDYRLITTGAADTAGIDGAIVQRQGDPPADGQAVNAYVCTIAVDSIEATEHDVPANGGRQVVERNEIPGVGLLSYFEDPEGNVFGALESVDR